jgi:7-cyano-7-deazaguanine synthase
MIIAYSGGLDSTVLLHKFAKEIKLAVSFNYGSKHNNQEIKFAKLNCGKLNIPHIVIDLAFINQYFKSSLLSSGGEIPLADYDIENLKSTVVPFRNGIMLSILAGLAESNNINRILLANHAGDHAIYPDCTPDFINYMNNAIKAGTFKGVQIFAPFTNITKREIALMGKNLSVDFSMTYSCYNGRDIHCGKCATCRERKEALNGFDPTQYED